MYTLGSFFSWPTGGVWSNLLASAIWTVPALAWHHRRVMRTLRAHHARMERIATVAAPDRQEAAR